MAKTKTRATRSDKGKARAPYLSKDDGEPNPISAVDMKRRFANSTSYATKVGIDKSYMYKCRDCGVLFSRRGAIAHWPQDCMELTPAILNGTDQAFGRRTLPPTIYPTIESSQPEATVHTPVQRSLRPEPDHTPVAVIGRPVIPQPVIPPTAKFPVTKPVNFSLDINEITAYLEWITKDRNEVKRQLKVATAELSRVKEAKLSTEFWNTYREFQAT